MLNSSNWPAVSWDSTGDTREGGGALVPSPNASLLCSLHFSILCGSLSWVKVLLLKKKVCKPCIDPPRGHSTGVQREAMQGGVVA